MPPLTIEQRFWPKVNVKSPDECWPWKGAGDRLGYGLFWAEGRSNYAHRIAVTLVGKQLPDKLFVLHTCDNPPCCNPNHLQVGTQTENMRQMIERGRKRFPVGDNVKRRKLNSVQVLEIRERLEKGETQRGLAREFNVAKSLIFSIKHRGHWKHI